MHMPTVPTACHLLCSETACRNEVSICFAPCVGIFTMKTVLFACVHNAGRSQMSNAMFNHLADPEKARGISAGTQPGTRVHLEVLVAMSELGVDLSSVQPQLLTPELAETSDLLITMGCGGSSSARQHKSLDILSCNSWRGTTSNCTQQHATLQDRSQRSHVWYACR